MNIAIQNVNDPPYQDQLHKNLALINKITINLGYLEKKIEFLAMKNIYFLEEKPKLK